jgi:hypothetical protein
LILGLFWRRNGVWSSPFEFASKEFAEVTLVCTQKVAHRASKRSQQGLLTGSDIGFCQTWQGLSELFNVVVQVSTLDAVASADNLAFESASVDSFSYVTV